MARRKRQRTCRGKRRFRDQDEALRTINVVSRKSVRDKKPVRAYECYDCRGWHITAREDWSA